MKDFYSAVTDSVNQRIGNPFVGSYLVAALVTNWKCGLLIFSGLAYQEKISHMQHLYPSYTEGFIMLFWLPLMAAVFWVFLWPLINKKIMFYWHKHDAEIENAKIISAKRKLMTEEQAARIYEQLDRQRKEYLDLTADRERTIETLLSDKQLADSKLIESYEHANVLNNEITSLNDRVSLLVNSRDNFSDLRRNVTDAIEYFSGVRTIYNFLRDQNDYSARIDFFKKKIAENLGVPQSNIEPIITLLLRLEVIKYENERVTFGSGLNQVESAITQAKSVALYPKL